MVDRWKFKRTETCNHYRIFSVRKDFYTHPCIEEPTSFYVIESPDWVNVIATTAKDEILLINQFRPGVKAVRLEIPGGVIEEGESPAEAASRELLEETGYEGDPPKLICVTEPNPATHNNKCFSFLIENATLKTKERNLDEKEIIDLKLMPYSKLSSLIRAGGLQHALLQVPLLHFMQNRENKA